MNFRELIDAAIGSPEPGHVNFGALHCLLCNITDRLNVLDEPVDRLKFGDLSAYLKCTSARKQKSPTYFSPHNNTGSLTLNKSKYLSRMMAGNDEVRTPKRAKSTSNKTPNRMMKTSSRLKAGADEEGAPQAETEDTAAVIEEPAAEPEAPEEVAPIEVEETKEPEIIEVVEEQTVEAEHIPAGIVEEPAEHMEHDEDIPEGELTTEMGKPVEISTPQYGSHKELVGLPSDIMFSFHIMREQMDLVMEHLSTLTVIVEHGKSKGTARTLRHINKRIRQIQRKIMNMTPVIEESSDISEETMLEELVEEVEVVVESDESLGKLDIKQSLAIGLVPEPAPEPPLEYHLCYTPERIMDQLLEVKSEYCVLTNKVNELTAAILEQQSHRTKILLAELQEQMRDVRYLTTILKDSQELMEQKQKLSLHTIDKLGRSLTDLDKKKIDKIECEQLLAEKVDYSELERKVSHEQLKEMRCRIEKHFCEMQRLINFNEKNALQIIENMRKNLGLDHIDEMLVNFRQKIDDDIHKLQEILQKFMDSTNDECAAAGARIKVLQDLACLSCDATCVMRTVEKSKIGKLPNAHATPALAPLITYELGSIRKSGMMGYYRKDEFPHAPNAWINRQQVALKLCVPRHAGGEHTTHTAKDHIEKVILSKQNTK